MAYPYDNVPTTVDVVYGPDPHHRFDHFKNPTRDPGGNPVLILRHGGGWTLRDKRMPSAVTDELGKVVKHLLGRSGPTDTHFDVISIGTRQEAWGSPISGSGYSYDEPHTIPTYYPETFEDMKRAVVAIKTMAATLTINPNKVALGGSSAGAVMAVWSQLTEPRISSNFAGSTETSANRYPSTGRSSVSSAPGSRDANQIDSTVKALYLIEPVFDFRQRGGVEVVAPGQWRALFGVKVNSTTGAFINAPSSAMRDAVSAAAYIERGHTRGWVPTMVSYATDLISGVADWTAGTNTLTHTGAFTNLGVQSTDTVRLFKSGYAEKLLPIATWGSNDTITTTGQFHTGDVTGVQYEIRFGIPYGTAPAGGVSTTRDTHNDQDIKKWIDLASSKGLVISGDKYSSYSEDNARKAYTFLAQQVGC